MRLRSGLVMALAITLLNVLILLVEFVEYLVKVINQF